MFRLLWNGIKMSPSCWKLPWPKEEEPWSCQSWWCSTEICYHSMIEQEQYIRLIINNHTPGFCLQMVTAEFPKVLCIYAFKVYPTWNLLSVGFKSEWATVKDHQLYVGGLGKAWTTPTGEVVNYHPQYIKKVSPSGEVSHIDWHLRYEALTKAAGISFPGKLTETTSIPSD